MKNEKSHNAEYNSASALHLAGKQRAQEYDLQLFLAYQLNVKQILQYLQYC